MIDFNPGEMQVADIIIVGPHALKGHLNVFGQRLIRRTSKRGRKNVTESRSHVMLAIGSGAIIHADGKKICTASLREYVDAHHLTEKHVRVVRRVGLTEHEAARISAEAHRFMDQKYSFIHGRFSTRLGKIHRSTRNFFTKRNKQIHTRPFCSELVARAYESVGIELTPYKSDQTLPLDIELACNGEDWIDVTAKYTASPWVTSETASPETRAFRDAFRASHFSALAAMERTTASQSHLLSDYLKMQYGVFEAFALLSPELVKGADIFAASPQILLHGNRPLVLEDLLQISDFYSRVSRAGIVADEARICSILRLAYPNASPEFVVYEGMPTLEAIEIEDARFHLRVLYALGQRLRIILSAMTSVIAAILDPRQPVFIDLATCLEWIDRLPPLPDVLLKELLDRATEIDKSEFANWDIEETVKIVFEAHQMCTTFKDTIRQAPDIKRILEARDYPAAASWVLGAAGVVKRRAGGASVC